MLLCAVASGALWLFSSTNSRESANDLLSATSERYQSLADYDFAGRQIVSLTPGCELGFPFHASRSNDRPIPLSIAFHSPQIPRPCMEEIRRLGSVTCPGLWSDFTTIDIGVSSIREFPQQVLYSGGRSISCVVLAVQYDEYNQLIRNLIGPVRYWIEPDTHFVWRVEFDEQLEEHPRHWIANIENMKLALPEAGGRGATDRRNEYDRRLAISKAIEDLEFRTASGEMVRLPKFRGKTVLLAFWATWCTPCQLEIPALEKLQDDAESSQAVVLGVTDESAAIVAEWLEKYHRHFRTLVDAKAALKLFDVKAIPSLVVIDRQGVMADYATGIRTENHLRELINKQNH